MSKVARSARVASRQRVESISADKTIASAETGETYIINAKSLITLPALQDGAYFKFIVGTEIGNDANILKIISSSSAPMHGVAVTLKNATAPAVVSAATGDSRTFINVDANGGAGNKMVEGSYIECTCDGSVWHVTAYICTEGTVATTFG